MMAGTDFFITATGTASFVLFFIVHILVFRFLKDEQILDGIQRTALAAGLCDLTFCLALKGVFAAGLSLLVYGLMVFVYVLCIFGPYETSIRMRLIREIGLAGSNGLTQEELLKRYNARTMLKVRLRRLTGSGDLKEEAGRYSLNKPQNMFFIIDAAAGVLARWIKP